MSIPVPGVHVGTSRRLLTSSEIPRAISSRDVKPLPIALKNSHSTFWAGYLLSYYLALSKAQERKRAHLIVFQAGDHDLCQYDHASAPHARAAVHQQGRIRAFRLCRAVRVAPHRLYLLQVRFKFKVRVINSGDEAP